MKHRIFLLFAVLCLLTLPSASALAQPEPNQSILLLPKAAFPSSPQATATINITPSGFDPLEVTIEAGDSVTFQNQTSITTTLKDGLPKLVFIPAISMN